MGFENTVNVIDRAISSHSENGTAFVLTRDGEPLFTYSAGLADTEHGMKFTEKTICRVFSLTKTVTSTACMMLIERGMLDTSWKLSRLIPEFGGAFFIEDGKKIKSPDITIRDLLNMTSGIAYPGEKFDGADGINGVWGCLEHCIRSGIPMTTQQFAADCAGVPLAFPAGRRWMYGSSADILGAVIEKASDTELAVFLKENIFDPLGMDDTAFFVPPEKRDRLAALYENAGEYPKRPDWVNLCIFDYESKPVFQSGGAGLFSTASDYSKLGAALSNGGGGILSQRTIDFMRSNGLSDEQRKTYDWDSTRGFGYANLVRMLEDRNAAGLLATKGSFGWDGWTGTFLHCDTEEKLSFTVFLQRCGAGTTQLARDIVNTVYASL